MNVNVRGAMVVAQIAARSMIERGVSGSIVNVSSQVLDSHINCYLTNITIWKASAVGLPLHTA